MISHVGSRLWGTQTTNAASTQGRLRFGRPSILREPQNVWAGPFWALPQTWVQMSKSTAKLQTGQGRWRHPFAQTGQPRRRVQKSLTKFSEGRLQNAIRNNTMGEWSILEIVPSRPHDRNSTRGAPRSSRYKTDSGDLRLKARRALQWSRMPKAGETPSA